jgi:hypothetical protein
MPDLKDFSRSKITKYDPHTKTMCFSPVTNFEQCLVARMLMRTRLSKEWITLILGFAYGAGTVGKCVAKWAPRWGKVGQHLSMLDIDKEYLEAECPQGYDDEEMLKIACLVDGKDILMEWIRKDKTMNRSQLSNKSGRSASREMCISTPLQGGLIFMYTRLAGGRFEENDLLKLRPDV